MLKFAIAALGAAVCFIAPASAQTFTHTVNGQQHAHNISTYTTHGTCCQHTTCGQSHNHGHTAHTYTQPTTRTYTTRTYSTAPTVTHTYTRPPATTHYVRPAAPQRIVTYPAQVHTPPRIIYHNDRAQPYAHYDSGWKHRTHGAHRGHHASRHTAKRYRRYSRGYRH